MNTALNVHNIHKNFGDSEILKGVSFHAKKGDIISIIGSSGSGKSTLLRCINFLEKPSEGRIILGCETIATKKDKVGDLIPSDKAQLIHIRTKLGMVFQSFNLWSHRTVLENIIEGPILVLKKSKSDAIIRAKELLVQVGLADKESCYPAELSGGGQQRVAIARALAMEPEIILFDEPTSALDPELVNEVTTVIRDLAKQGRTMIMVTHDMALAQEISTKIIFLHKGKIEEEGAPENLFQHPKSERLRAFLENFSNRSRLSKSSYTGAEYEQASC